MRRMPDGGPPKMTEMRAPWYAHWTVWVTIAAVLAIKLVVPMILISRYAVPSSNLSYTIGYFVGGALAVFAAGLLGAFLLRKNRCLGFFLGCLIGLVAGFVGSLSQMPI